ncbi:MAG: ornithine carbamoyltransferase [Pseudomonadota bacterium]
MSLRHFLSLLDLNISELNHVIQRGIELKAMQHERMSNESLKNRVLVMVFEKSSTRTRVSFEAAMLQCGGGSIFLSPQDSHLGRGEPVEDTARVLSRMADAVVIRCHSHDMLEKFAEFSDVPVINALSDLYHPCQLLADIQTWVEHRGSIKGRTVAWIGDGNNMCNSYINAARQFDFKLNIATPKDYAPNEAMINMAGDCVTVTTSPADAINGADLVVTDVWASMGHEQEQEKRKLAFASYQVDTTLMSLASPDALFMHCLPAHRGEEVSAEVIDGEQSIVWDEAENRLHAQKALLEFLLLK